MGNSAIYSLHHAGGKTADSLNCISYSNRNSSAMGHGRPASRTLLLDTHTEAEHTTGDFGEDGRSKALSQPCCFQKKGHRGALDDLTAFDVIPQLVDYLETDHRVEVQCRILKLLTVVMQASNEGKKRVVDAKACPIFIKLLASDSRKVASNAVWALKTVTDNRTYREVVIELGIVQQLICLIGRDVSEDITFKSKVFLCISNLLANGHSSSLALSTVCLAEIQQLLMDPYNTVMYDACLLLRKLIFTGVITISQLKKLRVVDRLVAIVNTLKDNRYGTLLGALYVLEAIAVFQSQAAIDHDALSALRRLLVLNDHLKLPADAIVLATRIFRYIVAGNTERLQIVLDRGWVALIVKTFQTEDLNVQNEAAIAINDLSCTCSDYPTALRFQQDILPGLADSIIYYQRSSIADAAGQILMRFLVNISRIVATPEQRAALCTFLNELKLTEQLKKMKQQGDVLSTYIAASWLD
ncbi:importin subunit alpha-3-like [Varroa jacobsoni]|uniref:importin subunit alpha-3-like n=1 Tax=Varroa jacobsoni TaxID=62625 RepID=UPI000BF4D94A|nr:importin subunit alpha-3-like [Varroa jacobsoni]XP_022702702.1 importin subunit alpha-3-like [Varroa jacobsoni]XP_022702703.1 importin subunit alpha-3-like [Varroa jacobsoni]XP_022702705.1 importin subunit alpha-3-like [Varroa jacobsoni]XP_022702706.1 importin subunit alpha-3-like [Varroa jacobsoni]XP_022702707.1 importin subunit alpha-3-like [Varroa jacobsoni]